MVALPPLKSTTSQVLDLAKEEQTKRQLCEGGKVCTKGSHIDHLNAAFKRGQRLAGKPLDTGAKIAFGKKYSG